MAVTAKLEVKGNQMKYVSRGGYKLEKAMDVFGIRLDGKICLDIGASTGGLRMYAAKAAQARFMPLMLAMGSLRGN